MRHFILASSFALICVLLLASSQAEVISRHFYNSNTPNQCSFKEYNLVLSPGESHQMPGVCASFKCYRDDGLGVIITCPRPRPLPNCLIHGSAKPHEPYPKCCQPNIICYP